MKKVTWNTVDPVRGSIHLNVYDEEKVRAFVSGLAALGGVGKEMGDLAVAQANEHLYGKRSVNYEYWKNRPELKKLKSDYPESFEIGRQVWMRTVVAFLYMVYPDETRPLIEKVFPHEDVPEIWVAFEAARAVSGLHPENERAREVACKRMPTVDAATKVAKAKRRKKGSK